MSSVCELTKEAGLAEVHIHALQTSVAVPRCHPLTAVAGDDNIEQVTITCNEHVHLWIGPGKLFIINFLSFVNQNFAHILLYIIFTYLQLAEYLSCHNMTLQDAHMLC